MIIQNFVCWKIIKTQLLLCNIARVLIKINSFILIQKIKVLSISREEPKETECKRFPCLARLRPCFAAIGRFFTRLWRFITKDRNWTSREKKCIVAIVTSVFAAIVFLGLFPSSFVYLDYYEVYTLQSIKKTKQCRTLKLNNDYKNEICIDYIVGCINFMLKIFG